MKINASRLLTLLGEHGFVRGGKPNLGDSRSFVRPDTRPGLFQWATVYCTGKEGDTVVGAVDVAVTSYIGTKGLVESRLLNEIAQVQARGWTIIKDAAQARTWEREFARIAPSRAAELATELGPSLLKTTAIAREAVRGYLGHVDQAKPLDEVLREFLRRADAAREAEAARLAGWPGVLQIRGMADIYMIACLCLVEFEKEVEKARESFVGQDPLRNRELMWRIQLLSDRFLQTWKSDTFSSAMGLET
jgi:hypothetical protein